MSSKQNCSFVGVPTADERDDRAATGSDQVAGTKVGQQCRHLQSESAEVRDGKDGSREPRKHMLHEQCAPSIVHV